MWASLSIEHYTLFTFLPFWIRSWHYHLRYERNRFLYFVPILEIGNCVDLICWPPWSFKAKLRPCDRNSGLERWPSSSNIRKMKPVVLQVLLGARCWPAPIRCREKTGIMKAIYRTQKRRDSFAAFCYIQSELDFILLKLGDNGAQHQQLYPQSPTGKGTLDSISPNYLDVKEAPTTWRRCFSRIEAPTPPFTNHACW